MIAEVGELERRDADLVGDVLPLGRRDSPRRGPASFSALRGFRHGHGDQVVQLQHAAGAGLERLAVRPVHGAEAEMLQPRLAGDAGLVAARNTCSKCVPGAGRRRRGSGRDHSSCTRSMMVARSVVPYSTAPSRLHQDQRRHLLLVVVLARPGRSARPRPHARGPWPSGPRPSARSADRRRFALPQVEVDAEAADRASAPDRDVAQKCRHSAR